MADFWTTMTFDQARELVALIAEIEKSGQSVRDIFLRALRQAEAEHGDNL